MKTLFKSFIVALFVFALALTGSAQSTSIVPYSATAVGSTNGASTLSGVIAGCNSINSGVPVVTFLNATSDKAASVVQFYKVTHLTVSTNANSTTTVYLQSTNGFAANDYFIVRHVANDTYERGQVSSVAAGSIVAGAAPLGGVVAGDIIYRIDKTGVSKIPVGNATLSLNGPGIYAGQRGCPIYAEVDSTTTGTLNAMAVTFIP